MKILWCWRCKSEVPMFDDKEFQIAQRLYQQGLQAHTGGMKERFKPLLDWHFEYTGRDIQVPNAIMHHEISYYGPQCEVCGKPYRTNKASFCAACGNRRIRP